MNLNTCGCNPLGICPYHASLQQLQQQQGLDQAQLRHALSNQSDGIPKGFYRVYPICLCRNCNEQVVGSNSNICFDCRTKEKFKPLLLLCEDV